MSNKTVIMYHSADHDGHTSGAIIKMYLDGFAKKGESAREIILYPINHGEEIDWDLFDQDTIVWMADFSLPPESFMVLLYKVFNVVWLDHHKKPIEKLESIDDKFKNLPGIREKNNSRSGCELSWEYCFPDEPMPDFVRHWGRFDIWDHSDQKKWDDIYEPFELGSGRFITDPKDNPSFWERLFSEGTYGPQGETMEEVIEKGEAIVHYVNESDRNSMKRAYEIEFEGMTCLAINGGGKGSIQFDELLSKYPMCLTYKFNGEFWVVGIYSDNVPGEKYDKPPIDCSFYAEKHGGGGHPGAAGFQIKTWGEVHKIFFEGMVQ